MNKVMNKKSANGGGKRRGNKSKVGAVSRETLMRDVPVGKALMVLGVPSVLAMVVEGLNMAVDKFYLGKLGSVEIAASNLFSILFMLGFGLVSVFMFGSSSYFTYVLGINKTRASSVRLNGIVFMVVVGIAYSLLGFALFEPWVSLFTPDADLYNATKSYTYAMLAGLPILYLFIGMSMFVKGEGAVNVVTFSLVASVLLNIILTPIMMFVFGWGIVGAALGTVMSNTLAILGMVAFYVFGGSMVGLRSRISWNKKFIRESFRRGFPEFSGGMLEGVVIGIGLVFASTYGGDLIASYGLFLSIAMLPMFIIWGFSHAVRILLSYNLGTRNFVRVRSTIRFATIFIGLIGLSIFTMFMIFPYQIVEFFVMDADVVSLVGGSLRIASPIFLLMGFIDLYINYLVALGRGVLGGSIQMVKVVVQVPLLFIALELASPMGIILVMPVAESVFIILGFVMMFSEKTFLQYLFGKNIC